MPKPEGPYIVWEDGGCEGWSPKSYPTLQAALEGHKYTTDWVLTKTVRYEVTEVGEEWTIRSGVHDLSEEDRASLEANIIENQPLKQYITETAKD